MSAPTLRVEVGFQQTAGFATPFQLDNATYGLLDTGTLGGIQMVDVTSMAQAVTITRGRNRQTESFNAGTASVRFYDPDRDLDPLNESSPYYPYVTPRQPIAIYANDIPIYTGLITDWNIDYDIAPAGTVTNAVCADNFTVLANMVMNAWTPSQQSTGERIEAVLTRPEIEYQGPYYIDTGLSTVGAYAVTAGTNVLQYLQTVNASELGYLFIDATGALRFRDRYPAAQPGIGTDATFDFTDDGSDTPYQSLTNQFGDELLFNFVQLQSPAGSPVTAEDAESAALYQLQQFSKLDLLNSSTDELQNMADYLVGQYGTPVLRFTSVETQLAALDTAKQNTVLGTEITSLVCVDKSFSTGTPSTVTQELVVTGISHNITPGDHRIRFTFENVDQRPFFILDSATNGVLDSNLIAF